MKADIVVDIGNTRLKWGLVDVDQADLRATESLADDPVAWQRALQAWQSAPGRIGSPGPLQWVVASVNPQRTERLRAWVLGQGHHFFPLRDAEQLPLRIDLPEPNKVGMDRLLNAVAVTRREKPGRGAILIDAGSAVTVDWLDESHAYCGGVIFPGMDLMAKALHDYTALLPTVSLTLPMPQIPARGTIPAMQAGIFLSVMGGIRETVAHYAQQALTPPRVFFSGGQASVLVEAMELLAKKPTVAPWEDYLLWPNQTLLGILHSVEALP